MAHSKARNVIVGAGIAGIAAAYQLAVVHGCENVTLVEEGNPLSLTSDKSTESYRNWFPGPDATITAYINRSIDLIEDIARQTGNRINMNRRGYLFASGRAGERFAVRNSGAKVVIEGCGSNGCEYMTGGVAVILGWIGANFAAGMTGGMAYVYDIEGDASLLINRDSVVTNAVSHLHWEAQLKGLIERHLAETGSRRAAKILADWDAEKARFLQVCPKEMLVHLSHPLTTEAQALPAE